MNEEEIKIEYEKLKISKTQLKYAFFVSILSFLISIGSIFVSIYNIQLNRDLSGGKSELELMKLIVSIDSEEKCNLAKNIGTIIHNQSDGDAKEWWNKILAAIGDCGIKKVNP